MNRFEARAIIDEALSGEMSEERAEELLRRFTKSGDLFIVTNEHACAGAARDGYIPTTQEERDACSAFEFGLKDPRHHRLEAVKVIEVLNGEKLHEWEDGTLQKVPVRAYRAYSAGYTAPDGRETRDECRSGPEAFVREADGSVRQLRAATALLARLLEARAAGA